MALRLECFVKNENYAPEVTLRDYLIDKMELAVETEYREHKRYVGGGGADDATEVV